MEHSRLQGAGRRSHATIDTLLDSLDSRPYCIAPTVVQTVADAADNVAVDIGTPSVDPQGMVVGDTIVLPASGVWLVSFSWGFAVNATGNRRGDILIDGTVVAHDRRNAPSGVGAYGTMSTIHVGAGTVTFGVKQVSGGNLDTTAGRVSAARIY